ncbi:glycoside hydrolase superfamily [Phycomyces blakesleeanus]
MHEVNAPYNSQIIPPTSNPQWDADILNPKGEQTEFYKQEPTESSWLRRHKKPVVATIVVARQQLREQENESNPSNPTSGHGHKVDDYDYFNNSARPNLLTPPLTEPFEYGKQKIRGVNIGGWLVTEPFITPDLFDQFAASDNIVDEWSLCKKLGPEEAERQLKEHYETFITEDDFRKIAEMGLNHVRIPTGHWAVQVTPDEPYVPHLSWTYLLKGVQWARKYGLRVMVELHTAPGSQNGWNHSGHKGKIGWLNGPEGEANAERTMKIIQNMTDFFSAPEWANVAPIFGVLNEPAIYRLPSKKRVKEWYQTSYDMIRNSAPAGGPLLTYHEGFLGMPEWNGFFTEHNKRVILETHNYLIFDQGLVSMNRESQAAFPCGSWRSDLGQAMKDVGPTMVGEFSVATNDCGKYLNGVGLGTRMEGTFEEDGVKKPPVCPTCNCQAMEDWTTWDDGYKRFLKSFAERQMDAFETSYGWFFWTYKTQNHANPHWDYLLGWEQGWIPKDANHRESSCTDTGL